MSIIIIKATPGLNTSERILELMKTTRDGMTVKELSEQLNRPISMVQTCLKLLVSSQGVYVRKNGAIRCYYLREKRPIKQSQEVEIKDVVKSQTN